MKCAQQELKLNWSLMIAVISLVTQTHVAVASAAPALCTDLFTRSATSSAAAIGQPSLSPERQQQIEKAIQGLSALRLSLDQAKARGANSIEQSALAADYRKKEQDLIRYLETYKIMTREQLVERMKREILQIQRKKQSSQTQTDQAKETESQRRQKHVEQIKASILIDGSRAVMHKIKHGSFKMGEMGNQVDVTLTKDFEMSATKTTQIIWGKVADLAAKKFPGKYPINADPSHFKGDTRPVESVSYEEIQIWFDALNELSQAGEPALSELITGHKKGDVYRLPTEAEWEFVVRNRGRNNERYYHGNDQSQITGYEWSSENSNDQTQPVAQKLPHVVEGMDFYDMLGNVHEWVQDWYGRDLPGGIDPQGPSTGEERVVRGGSYNRPGWAATSDIRPKSWQDYSYNDLGFRFVRIVK